MCAESFCKNFHLDDSGISLPAFPARIKLKMHNISITLQLIEKVIIYLDLPKGSGTLYIPLVVLRKYESELSYILAELFSMGLWESFFPVFQEKLIRQIIHKMDQVKSMKDSL